MWARHLASQSSVAAISSALSPALQRLHPECLLPVLSVFIGHGRVSHYSSDAAAGAAHTSRASPVPQPLIPAPFPARSTPALGSPTSQQTRSQATPRLFHQHASQRVYSQPVLAHPQQSHFLPSTYPRQPTITRGVHSYSTLTSPQRQSPPAATSKDPTGITAPARPRVLLKTADKDLGVSSKKRAGLANRDRPNGDLAFADRVRVSVESGAGGSGGPGHEYAGKGKASLPR